MRRFEPMPLLISHHRCTSPAILQQYAMESNDLKRTKNEGVFALHRQDMERGSTSKVENVQLNRGCTKVYISLKVSELGSIKKYVPKIRFRDKNGRRIKGGVDASIQSLFRIRHAFYFYKKSSLKLMYLETFDQHNASWP